MSVVTVPVQMDVPKESKEIVDLVVSVIADIKAGKPAVEIAAGNLPKLIMAFDGYDKLDDEFKSQYRDELGAYISKSLLAALAPAAPSA